MRQIENINKIEYLKKVFNELQMYDIDVSVYSDSLNKIILRYEESKRSEHDRSNLGKIDLYVFNDWEMNLFMDLSTLELELQYYILFLDLIHLTNDWNIDVEIDSVFYKVSHNFERLLNNFCKIDIQKLIVEKYHDLLWKKILKDYQNNDFGYLNKYDDLKKYVYLQDSIKRYGECNNIFFVIR